MHMKMTLWKRQQLPQQHRTTILLPHQPYHIQPQSPLLCHQRQKLLRRRRRQNILLRTQQRRRQAQRHEPANLRPRPGILVRDPSCGCAGHPSMPLVIGHENRHRVVHELEDIDLVRETIEPDAIGKGVAVVDIERGVFSTVEPLEKQSKRRGIVVGEMQATGGGAGGRFVAAQVCKVGDFGAENGFVDAEGLRVRVRANGDVD
ncbi:hypothetical protein ACMFMG_003936 [Clarireedia jacksonii]